MNIKKFTFDQMLDLVYNYNNSSNRGWILPITKEYCFENFYYFAPSNFGFGGFCDHPNEEFIVAFKNNIIIGVICYGIYGYDHKYQAVSFIDVHKQYRNKGVATELIKELNNHIDKSQPLVLSSLSQEGKKYHIDEVFKKYIDTEIKLDY